MTSYQKLKNDYIETVIDLSKAKDRIAKLESALWEIAMMRGPKVTEAPETALKALHYETKKTQN